MKNETPAAQNQNFINNTDEKLYNTYLVNSQTCDITPAVNEARKNPQQKTNIKMTRELVLFWVTNRNMWKIYLVREKFNKMEVTRKVMK